MVRLAKGIGIAALLAADVFSLCRSGVTAEPPSAASGIDEATGVAVDAAGAVLVVGFSQSAASGYDYVTLKYAPDGRILWVRRYDGPGGEDDKAVAVATDAAGNIYVTGSSEGEAGAGRDIATIKYSPDGVQLWEKRYNGPGNGYDTPIGLAVDRSGNVCVAGYSRGLNTGLDYVALKYAPDGTELWEKRFDGDRNGDDRAVAMAVDAVGNVYLTGSSSIPKHSPIALTVKYAPDGKVLWAQRSDSISGASALAVSSSGDVYVTGPVVGRRNSFLTLKYSPEGRPIWTQRYAGSRREENTPVSLELDSAGDIYVMGAAYTSANSGAGYACVTLKYAPSGKTLWQQRYEGPGGDRPASMRVDARGGVTITGDTYSSANTGHDFFTIQYDSDGKFLWSDRYDGDSHHTNHPVALTIDAQNNAYVVGYSWGGSIARFDFTTLAYAPNGGRRWVRSYDGATATYGIPDTAQGVQRREKGP